MIHLRFQFYITNIKETQVSLLREELGTLMERWKLYPPENLTSANNLNVCGRLWWSGGTEDLAGGRAL